MCNVNKQSCELDVLKCGITNLILFSQSICLYLIVAYERTRFRFQFVKDAKMSDNDSLEWIAFRQMMLFVVMFLLCTVSRDLLLLDSIRKVPWRRAVTDNLVHITLGFLSWLIVVSLEKTCHPWHIACCLLCGFFAGFVDVDHFLMAKSLRLSDALNLPSRPPFHNTTLMLSCIILIIFLTHIVGYERVEYIGWIVLVAVISHHLRDSLHRGLWLWPISLKPFSYPVCILLSYCFPLFLGSLMSIIHRSRKSSDYSVV